MSDHSKNLPWHFRQGTVYDNAGVPVAVALPYTSVNSVDENGNKTFNTSESAQAIRVQMIVDAINEAGE